MRHRTLATWLLLGLVAGLLSACVGPTTSAGRYREHAAGALEDMVEVSATLRLVAENAAADHLTPTYATVLAREQEERATYADSAFASRQPTPSTDEVRERVTALLGEGVDLAARARILADRGELAEFGALAARFGDLHDRLEVLEAEMRLPARDDGGDG